MRIERKRYEYWRIEKGEYERMGGREAELYTVPKAFCDLAFFLEI